MIQKLWMIMVSVNGQVHSRISTCIFLLLSSRSNNKDDFLNKRYVFCSKNFCLKDTFWLFQHYLN